MMRGSLSKGTTIFQKKFAVFLDKIRQHVFLSMLIHP